MINYKGIWLPDGEEHYQMIMDSPKSPEIDGKATYQFRKLKKTLLRTSSRRVAIDIGANIGLWSMHLVRHFEFVHAFEPAANYRDCFERNVEGENHELYPVALGSDEFEWPLIQGTPGQTGNTYLDPDHDVDSDSDVEMVPVKVLDSFNIRNVDMIKVDCEGYELPILQGGEKTIVTHRPTIIVEQKPGWPTIHGFPEKGAVDYLEGLGMVLHMEYSGDFIMVWK